MRIVIVLALIGLAACSPRAEIAFGSAPGARALPIFVGTTRNPDPENGEAFGYERDPDMTLARFDVAIPPEHKTGTLTVPTKDQKPDPEKDFLVAQARTFPTAAAFRKSLHGELSRDRGEAIVFVHGYNTNFAEGIYRFAQMGTDFDLPRALVAYSWPSRAEMLGYAYDHDSALFARDGLSALLDQIRRSGAREILLVGHSMGGFLVMEALRQMAIAGDRETLSKISGVVLISPDIDVDVFREDARRIGRLPQPFIVFTSQDDKALRLSAQLSGEPTRLGNLTDISRVADLPVTMIDTAAFDTQIGHFNVATSPDLIELLKNSRGFADVLERDQSSHHDPFASAALTVQNATRIVLTPITALGQD